MTMHIRMPLEDLEELTSYSYSYERYSPEGWRDCIRLLRERGLSDLEVEAVLMSKHMVFAANMSEDKRPWGSNGKATLEEYMDEYPLSSASIHVLIRHVLCAPLATPHRHNSPLAVVIGDDMADRV